MDSDHVPPDVPGQSLDDCVHERRRRINNAAITIIAIILGLAAFTLLGPVLQPVLAAIFLFFILKPAADWFVRRGLREWVAWLTLFAGTVVLGILLTQMVYSEYVKFEENIYDDIDTEGRPVVGYRTKLLNLASNWTGYPKEEIEQASLTELFGTSTDEVVKYMTELTFGVVELFLMIFFYLMFVILDARDVPGRVRRAFEKETAEHLLHVGDSIIAGFTGYMRVKTQVGLGMGATAGLITWAFGLPHWPLWAFLTFLLNYVTYIGSLLILVPPIALAFAEVSVPAAIVVAILLCLNRFVWIDYVEIHHTGRQLNINSVLILMSLAYWGWFWGILGLILAVPMLTCLKIVLSNFEPTKRWAVLMTED